MKEALARTFFALALAGSAGVVLAGGTGLTTERLASGLDRPIGLGHVPGDADRLFITEQKGVIKILDLNTNTVLATPYLNIDSLVFNPSGNDERGLLGLAFHPDYADNGHFFVHYTNNGGFTSVLARYTVSGDPNVADAGSASLVMNISQPFSNHNGGWIGFGPNDGYLYVALGDGGSGCDPSQRAQDITDQLLGKMLRIDIDDDDFPGDANKNYAIPADNPFVGISGDDEIWAYGLRNPWRNSFDRATGDLYIGDVGQVSREEIDFQPASSVGGENYGWDCEEGFLCSNTCSPDGCACGDAGIVSPIHDYPRGSGFSVTGGYVYRGAAIPDLQGTYFFADFGTARIWSFRYDGANMTEFEDRTTELAPGGGIFIGSIASFGEDANGELYICDRAGTTSGEVYRIIPVGPDATIVNAHSIRRHGGPGGMDLAVDLTASNGIEARQGGIDTLTFEFDEDMNATTVSCTNVQIECGPPNVGCASATLGGDQRTVTVDVGGNTDAMMCCTFGFAGMETAGGGGVADEYEITVLEGDVNYSGAVTGADPSLIKPHFGEIMGVDLTDPKWDFDVSGGVTGGDYSLIKPLLGDTAPACQ